MAEEGKKLFVQHIKDVEAGQTVEFDKVTFCSIFGLDSLIHKPAFPKNPLPVNGFEPMINEKQGKDLPF